MKKLRLVFDIEVNEDGMKDFRLRQGHERSSLDPRSYTGNPSDGDVLAAEAQSNWEFEGLTVRVQSREEEAE